MNSMIQRLRNAKRPADRQDGDPTPTLMKARQALKIKELGEALAASGSVALDDQAGILGLSRSTTWNILRANHKSSGLSAAIIKRMLSAPNLPPIVRSRILEYVEEKLAGVYGHSKLQRTRFSSQVSAICIRNAQFQLVQSGKTNRIPPDDGGPKVRIDGCRHQDCEGTDVGASQINVRQA